MGGAKAFGAPGNRRDERNNQEMEANTWTFTTAGVSVSSRVVALRVDGCGKRLAVWNEMIY